MGVGANPTVWFVVLAFLSIVLNYVNDLKKEVPMKAHKKGNQMKFYLKKVVTATIETSWAITTGLAAGLVTPSIHAKGAPRAS